MCKFKKLFLIYLKNTILFMILFYLLSITIIQEEVKAGSNTTLSVGGQGLKNYSYIQDAIDNSSNNDSIIIYPGEYHETIIINKSLSLSGINKNSTILMGNNSLYTILIKSSFVNITNITIKNSKMGVYIFGLNYSNNSIEHNIISENSEGIRILYSSNNSILNNDFIENLAYGIVLYESKNNDILQNYFFDSITGIDLDRWSNDNTILNNNFTQNNLGIRVKYSYFNQINKNYFGNGGIGLSLEKSNNNSIENNTIIFQNDFGIYLIESEKNIIEFNNFSNNYNDIKIKGTPPSIKTPDIGIIFTIFAVFFVFFLKNKILNN